MEFATLSRLLMEQGVTMTILKVAGDKALIYLYRAEELEKSLADEGVRRLLATCGYLCFDADGALDTLRKHLYGFVQRVVGANNHKRSIEPRKSF